MLRAFERWLVFPAPAARGADWVAADLPHEDVHFNADDGTQLHGWYVPHPAPRAVVLFSHGNGEHVARLAPTLALLRERAARQRLRLGLPRLRPQQGQAARREPAGRRPHRPALARRARRHPARRRRALRPLARRRRRRSASPPSIPVRGMVLERTFADMVDTAAYHFPWLPVKWIMRNRFPSVERIAAYQGPLLQSHGTADHVVPFEMGKQLFDAATTPNKRFFVVEGGDHNGPQPDEYYEALGEFLDALPPIERQAPHRRRRPADRSCGDATSRRPRVA